MFLFNICNRCCKVHDMCYDTANKSEACQDIGLFNIDDSLGKISVAGYKAGSMAITYDWDDAVCSKGVISCKYYVYIFHTQT